MAANQAIATGDRGIVQFEHVLPASDGRPARQLLATKVPVRDATGAIVQILTMGTDVTALKQAQAAADMANRLVEGILTNVPLTIQVKDADLRFRWVNRAFGEAFGRDPASLLGKTVEALAASATAIERTNAMDREVLAERKTIRFNEHVGDSGLVRQLLVIKAPILDAAGNATHVITIGADVTELERLRAETEEVRRRLQTVLDAVPVTIALKDTGRRFLWVNREYERVHGPRAAEVIGRRTEDVRTDPDLAAAVSRLDNLVIATGASLPPMPQRHAAASGEMRDYSVRRLPVRDAAGAIEGILVVSTDVTDLLHATAELRRLNKELEQRVAERAAELEKANTLVSTVVRSAPVPIVTFRQDGSISGWNPAATKVMGYSEHEALNGLIPAGDIEAQRQFDRMRHQVLAGDSFANVEVRRSHKDGKPVDLLMSGAPLRGPDGAIAGAVGIWLDVSALRATEQQLRQAQKMEAVGQLTGGVAHDFNNLLAVIMGNLELLAQDLPASGDSQAVVSQAIEAAERGASLIRRLLAFSRQQTLRPAPVDVDLLLARMEPLLQRAVGEAIVIERTTDPDPWLALVDPSQLESAILNLSVNARDAMPAGGRLTIALSNRRIDPDAEHPDLAAGDYVCVAVADTGTGIAPEVLGQVFEPFFTTKEVGKGSGLGLSMVFGFVKQSGGHIQIDTAVGQGTTIMLYLPRTADSAVTRDATHSAAAGQGETILLVEDNPALRRTSASVVAALGYKVVTAADAGTALALLDAHPDIRLLFSDIVLTNGATGFDLARAARRRRPGLPVLLTSGFADPAFLAGGGPEADMVILPKPFRRAELATRLGAALGKHAAG